MNRTTMLLVSTALALSAARSTFAQTADVTVPAGNGFVHLTARTPDVIHVQYATDKLFFEHPSLSALPLTSPPPKCDVTSDASSTTLSTDHLKARIDLKTGAVRFLDPAGNAILAEKDNGRTVEPA